MVRITFFSKTILVIVFFFLFFTLATNNVLAACVTNDFAGGSGTELDPWQIETPQQLSNVGTCLGSAHANKYFILNNSINLDVAPYNTGEGWTPIGIGSSSNGFYGKFNGNYHTVSNLFINRPNSGNQGLFGYVETGGLVENIMIENPNVTGGGSSGVASLIGYHRGTVRNAGVEGGSVSSLMRSGGLIGYATGGNSQRIFARNITVTQRAASNQCCIGGLIGGNENNSVFADGYARTTLVHTSGGQGAFGGLIGNTNNSGAMSRGYSASTFTTLATPPGSLGALQGSNFVSISNGYWDTEASTGFNSSPTGTGLTTAQMKEQANYENWDFDTVWAIDPAVNDGYPYFQWETNVVNAPIITALNPLDNATDVATDVTLSITFDRPVGTETGAIVIYNSGGSVFESIDVAVGSIGGNGTATLTIDPVNNFIEGNSYYVLIESTAIRGTDGIFFAGINNPEVWNFSILDATPPEIVELNPADNAVGVSLLPNLQITFNEPVVFADGTINVYRASDNELHVSIPVSGGDAELVRSVTFLEPLDQATEYYVLISNDAFEDASGNAFAGINDPTIWSFTTRSLSDPLLSFPINNIATNDIFIDFELSEAMLAGTLQLIFAGDETITLTLEDVAVDTQTTFTLDQNNLLATPQVVAVSQNTIPDGVYTVTLSHQNLQGITLSTSTSQVTIDTVAPTLNSVFPLNGANDISVRPTLSLTFDESVAWFTGSVQIYRADTNTLVVDIPAGGGPGLGGSGSSTLTVALQNNLEPFTEYYVLVEDSALRDFSGNSFVGINDPLVWRFLTGARPVPISTSRLVASLGVQRSVVDSLKSQKDVLLQQVQELEILVQDFLRKEHSENFNTDQDTTYQQENNNSDSALVCIPFLRFGSRGESVARLQTLLKTKSDGVFGRLTQEAVRKLQLDNGLTVDGIAGPQTCGVL